MGTAAAFFAPSLSSRARAPRSLAQRTYVTMTLLQAEEPTGSAKSWGITCVGRHRHFLAQAPGQKRRAQSCRQLQAMSSENI